MSNPFKAFIPYAITRTDRDAMASHEDLDAHAATDPTGGMWRTAGLVAPIPGDPDLLPDIDNSWVMCVQFNERILPGKVRDEMLKKRVAEIEDREGRKVNKKEYAQLRDQVEFDLLPRAFIRRTNVLIAFTNTYMLVFTSSAKRADDVVALLRAVFGEKFQPAALDLRLTGFLHDVLLEGQAFGPDGDSFTAGMGVVLKGEDKETIRVKDKDVTEHDVFTLAKGGYLPSELEIAYADDSNEPVLTFNLKSSGIFSRVDTPSVKAATKLKEDFVGHAVLCVSTIRSMLNTLVKVTAEKTAAEDDDEL